MKKNYKFFHVKNYEFCFVVKTISASLEVNLMTQEKLHDTFVVLFYGRSFVFRGFRFKERF